MRWRNRPLVWRQVWWPRPFTPDQAAELVERIAADRNLGEVVLEARAQSGHISYYLATHSAHIAQIEHVILNLVPGARLTEPRAHHIGRLTVAGHLKVSHPSLALSVDRVTSTTRAVMAGLAAATSKDELVVLQVIIGGRLAPRFVRPDVSNPTDTWFDLLRVGARPANADTRTSLKNRSGSHGAKLTIRVGATASTLGRTRELIMSVLGGLRVAQAAGVRINLVRESPAKLIGVTTPWRWPLRLSCRELIPLFGWPIESDDDAVLPGQPNRHPKLLPPPRTLQVADRPFAETTAPGVDVQFGISAPDTLQHTILLGPTASGKSTAMLSMILDAIRSGRGVLVIDPKSDLVNDVLARIPENRVEDVVVIDPTDPRPVGLNPLTADRKNPALTADSLLAVFRDLSGDSWGPRTQDVLASALLTLSRVPGATLPMLPSLLTDDAFRKRILRHVDDELGLGSFWSSYDAISPALKAQVIAPTMSRLRQFLLRPQLRAVLGQSDPAFNLSDLFTHRRIVLISLNRGQLGTESARLLGSLVVSQLWPLILRRAGLPPERRHVVNVFIDEVQDYLSLPTDLEDALSQARSLGVGFTLAHQYRRQLPAGLRAGVDANARNKIIFGLNGEDAAEMAKQAPELDSEDFQYLGRFSIYTNLMQQGHSTGWFSARTLPPEPPTQSPAELRARSSTRYGRDANEVDRAVLDIVGREQQTKTQRPEDGIGRRRRSEP